MMNYKEAFAVDEIYYSERKKDSSYEATKFELKNFDYYKPKLVDDFYLKYFTRKLLIEIDILEIKDFLQFHYDYCENQDIYISILKYKILPKIEELVEFAQPSFEGGGYHDVTKLEDGFVESEGVVHNSKYDYDSINHYVAFNNLQNDIKKRAEIITSFYSKLNQNISVNALKWNGKPTHLAYIISQLVNEGYIDAPLKSDGEINYTELSKQIINSFNFSSKEPSIETLRRYSSNESEKYFPLDVKFKQEGFYLPNSKIMS